MIDWNKLKNDISNGIKDGSDRVVKKAGELSVEGQRKVKVFKMKKKIQDSIAELGAIIYNAEKLNPGTINHNESIAAFKVIESLSKDLQDLEDEKVN